MGLPRWVECSGDWCKSQHAAGGICMCILVGKQLEGEISGPATAQKVMQIPPAACWDLHIDHLRNRSTGDLQRSAAVNSDGKSRRFWG
jgi:hypothetical protein